MASPRAKSAMRAAGGLGLAWALVPLFLRVAPPLHSFFHRAWWSGAISWDAFVRDRIGEALEISLVGSYVAALVLATILVPLGFAVRTMLRARVRAGNGDAFARVRRWMGAHPRWTTALASVLPFVSLWFGTLGYFAETNAYLARHFSGASFFDELLTGAVWVAPALLAVVGLTALVRAGLRAFVSPTLDASEPQRDDVSRDEIAFDAVAVTFETRAAVGGMAALPFGLVALMNTLDTHKLSSSGLNLALILAYVTLALGGAFLFQRASRIGVGLDGVFVTGTSRTRFFAYRDLDGARVKGGDLELLRGQRAILRLQLHGEDAARRQAVLERIQVSIARAKEERRDVTTDFVSSASGEELSRAAQGAGDYRAAAVSREQLWAIVEGPAIDSGARRAAAEALAGSGDDLERARLRVAADHCADPQVRVALQKLAEPDETDDEVAAPPPSRRAQLR